MDSNKHTEYRNEVAYWMRRLYARGLTTCSGGNISLKSGEFIYLTASQSDKARIRAGNICILTPDGENVCPELKPSIETGMHLAVYNSNPAVQAIVHAHPENLSMLSCLNQPVKNVFTGEQRFILGEIGTAVYKIMGSKALAEEVAFLTQSHRAVIMQNHGAITVGKNLFEAFDRMEVFERLASQVLFSLQKPPIRVLSETEIRDIDLFK
ncbi:MAG TPA: class II aldolase/adducin family protein [Bacteroidales bacterium]|nr:class II aldolase/adducin family protein [Bacteroidales bacterium]